MKLLLTDGLRSKCHEGAHEPGEEEGEETKVEIMEPVHCRLHKLRPDKICHKEYSIKTCELMKQVEVLKVQNKILLKQSNLRMDLPLD